MFFNFRYDRYLIYVSFEDHHPPDWKASEIVNGIGTITMPKWKDFVRYFYLEKMFQYSSYIWRGQRCDDWLLQSTLSREMDKRKLIGKRYVQEHLDTFKYATRGRRGSNPCPISDENEWWALGQHHGLKTPLLDWTHSPFVAAYFAYIDIEEKQTDNRIIYALSKPSVESVVQKLKAVEAKKNSIRSGQFLIRKKNNLVEFVKPFGDDNQRLINQNGLFTRSPINMDLEQWICTQFQGKNDEYILMKFLIPNVDRTDALQMLNRMNINHLSLFPDLTGASIFSNLSLEIDDY